jgi:hypothetical protein
MKISFTHTLVQKWGESDLYSLRNNLIKLLYPDTSRNLRRRFSVLSQSWTDQDFLVHMVSVPVLFLIG